jgi:hypothetical protein
MKVAALIEILKRFAPDAEVMPYSDPTDDQIGLGVHEEGDHIEPIKFAWSVKDFR